MSLGTLNIDVLANIAGMVADMGKAQKEAEKAAEGMRRSFESGFKRIEESAHHAKEGVLEAFTALTGLSPSQLGIGVVIAGLGELTKKAIETGDQMNKMSQRIGISVESLSGLAYAADLSDVAFGDFGSSMEKFAKTAASAAGGSREQAAAFEAIGISVKDTSGAIKPMDQLLAEVSDRFAQYKDSAEKTALAQVLFGKSGAQMIPLLNQGSEGMRSAAHEAEQLGYNFQGIAKPSEEFNDNLRKMKAGAEGLGIEIAQQLLPGLIRAEEGILDFIKSARESGSLRQIAEGIKLIVDNLDTLAVIIGTRLALSAAISAISAIGSAAAVSAASVGILNSALTVLGGPAGIIALAVGLAYKYTTSLEQNKTAIDAAAEAIGKLRDANERNRAEVVMSTQETQKQTLAQLKSAQASLLAAEQQAEFLKSQQIPGNNQAAFASRFASNENATTINRLKGEIQGLIASSMQLDLEIAKNTVLLAAHGEEAKKTAPNVKNLAAAQEDGAKKAQDLASAENSQAQFLAKLRGEIGPVTKAHQDYVRQLEDTSKHYDELIAKHAPLEIAQQAMIQDVEAATAAYEHQMEMLEKQSDVMTRVFTQMKDESALAGLSDRERYVAEAVKKVTEEYAHLSTELQALHPITQQDIEDAKAQAAAIYDATKARENDRSVIEEWANIAKSGFDSVARTISDFATRSIKSWKDFGKALIDDAKQMIAQVIEQFLKLKLINPMLNNMFGGVMGLLPTAGNAAGGGGLGGILGGLFGGQELAGPPAAGATSAGSSVGLLGSLGSILPTIGIVAAGAGLLNSLTKGGLFGTNWATKGSNTSFSVGESGGSVTTLIEESKKKAFFGGTKTRTVAGPVDASAQQAITDFETQLKQIRDQASAALGVASVDVVSASFKQVYDKKGQLKDQFSTVLGQIYHESLDDFKSRAQAETLISQVSKTAEDASTIANQWRDSASKLLGGAQFLLAAQVDISKGNSLIGESLAETTTFVTAQAKANETLVQTYARLEVSTALLKQATELMGVNLGKSREDFVTFAASIADAAGGLQQAQALWSDFFKNFYSQSEQSQAQLDALKKQSDSSLSSIGLGPDTTMAEFRALFEQQMPTLSADAVAQWLKAAEALAQATQAQAQYTDALGQTATQAEKTAQDLAKAKADYADFMNGIKVGAGTLDAFGKALKDIQKAEVDNIAKANQLAKAAGMQGAAESDLALIHQAAARSAAQAIAELENSAVSLAQSLYGSTTSSMQSLASASGGVSSAVSSAADSMKDFSDSLLTGSLSPLNDSEKLQEGMKQLMAASAAGNASEVQRLAQETLQTGQRYYATGSDYRGLFDQVQQIVANTHPAATGGGGGGGYDYSQSYQPPEVEIAARRADADRLAQMIADLAVAEGKALEDVAKQIHVPLDKLAGDLGLTSEDLMAYLKHLEQLTTGSDAVISDLGPGGKTNPLTGDGKKADQTPTPWQKELSTKVDELIKKIGEIATSTDKGSERVQSAVQSAVGELQGLRTDTRTVQASIPFDRSLRTVNP